MRVRRTMAAAAALIALAGCADDSAPSAEQASSAPTASAAPSEEPSAEAQQLPPLPAGWRWESYRDVVVGVPGDWLFNGGRLHDWCAGIESGGPPPPGVGRPGLVLGIGCPQASPGEPDPGSLLKNGGTYVFFAGTADRSLKSEGDREVLRIGSTAIVIQAPQALREQIAETVQQRNDADHNGCPLDQPISADPAWRPSPIGPAALTNVTSMTACRYYLRTAQNQNIEAGGPTLVSSTVVAGDRARSTAAAIAASPGGGGPDEPSSCIEDVRYGDEAVVVRVDHGGGAPDYLVVRYSGCNYNGVDDGSTVHPLTPENARAFFTGPNHPSSYSGPSSKMEVLSPDDAGTARAKESAIPPSGPQ